MKDSRKKQLLDSIRYQANLVAGNKIGTVQKELSMAMIIDRLDQLEQLEESSQVRETTVITLHQA